jgi:hypothetical protein
MVAIPPIVNRQNCRRVSIATLTAWTENGKRISNAIEATQDVAKCSHIRISLIVNSISVQQSE